jgi:bile acid-coenzyme A ligase
MTLGAAVAWQAARNPDRVAIIDDRQGLTWAQLDSRTNRLARVMATRGVTADSLVSIVLPNGIPFVQTVLAVWKLGATPNPISSGARRNELEAIIELAAPSLLVAPTQVDGFAGPTLTGKFEIAEVSPDPHPVVAARAWKATTSGGSTGLPKIIVSGDPGFIDPDEPAVIGAPVDGNVLIPGPMYHNGPFSFSMQALLSGNTLVIMDRFQPERTLALIERHRINWMPVVPTMMSRIAKLPADVSGGYDLSSLDAILHFGSVCAPDVKRWWIDFIGASRVHEIYGSAEGLSATWITGDEWLAHPCSVGRPIKGQIRVLRPDGSECAPGETGELFMLPNRGPGSTYHYLGASGRLRTDGWESVGDIGHVDADGYVFIADRRTDMIISGGANVYPAEVEGVLEEHPAVESSAVVGVPDTDLGQRIHAVVYAPGGLSEESLRAHLAARLDRYKIPRTFEFSEEPVRDDAGKVRRSALARAAQHERRVR